MDIKLSDHILRHFLETQATTHQIANALSLCGPTVDRLEKVGASMVYEIEVITNRVDSASAFGIAREAAAILPIQGQPAKIKINPYDYLSKPLPDFDGPLELKVQILDQSLVPHFAAIVLEQIQTKPAPNQMQKDLELSGQRPINNLVDITNYLTLCFGQPVHIFDYDKIGNATLKIRASKKGEKILTLDGKSHALNGGDIVIEDGKEQLIDLCGIMGGELSKVDENTKRVVLFVQTYDPKKIRKTSLYTQERTLAAQIFEKRPDPELVIPTILEGIKMLEDYADARVASKLIHIYPQPPVRHTITLSLEWLNSLVGINIPQIEVLDILSNLGFEPEIDADMLTCIVPTWRIHDITIKEDIVEEVARVYGFYRLPGVLPQTTAPKLSSDNLLSEEIKSMKYLADLGFTQVLTSSLISAQILQKVNIDPEKSLKVTNPLSDDYEYLRTSLIPGALQTISVNQGKVSLPIRIFELSNIYLPTSRSLPDEISTLTVTVNGLSFLEAKGYFQALMEHLRCAQVQYESLEEPVTPFLTTSSVKITKDNTTLGIIGEIDPQILLKFGISDPVFIIDVNFASLVKYTNQKLVIRPVSKYNPIIEDLTIQTNRSINDIIQEIQSQTQVQKVEYLTSYNNKHTFRIYFQDSQKNLTHEEIIPIKEKIIKVFDR